ncbi:MAG TPA: zf-HC2 domain-containing protein [Ktedonobacterales bacterium]|nr:zf-HC2 domain-containing protein [Ktedonobacterales bacterium]
MRLESGDTGRDDTHISALLPAYLRGALAADDVLRVRDHLRACVACRDELALRGAVIRRTNEEMAALAVPSPALLEHVWQEPQSVPTTSLTARHSMPTLQRKAAWAWALIWAQARLLPSAIWAISTAAMFLALVIGLAWNGHTFPPLVLGFFVTTSAAGGATLLYGPEHDPALEVALATQTRPRAVLFCRFVLGLGYNACLALGVTTLLALAQSGGFVQLASSWVGPMLLLTGLSLLLSVRRGSVAGVAAIAGLWCLRLILLLAAPASGSGPQAWLAAIWQTTPLTLAAAAILCLAAVLAVPREAHAA